MYNSGQYMYCVVSNVVLSTTHCMTVEDCSHSCSPWPQKNVHKFSLE